MKPSKKRGSSETNEKQPMTFGWQYSSLSDSHRLVAIYRLLDGDEKLLQFLFDLREPKLRLSADCLLSEAECLSHGEKLLILAGIDLWCGEGHLDLGDALSTWDDKNFTHFIQAICHLKEIRNSVMHTLIDDENCDGIPL